MSSGGMGSGTRLGLFGGSFDPIHRGHVEPVQEARRRFALDRVLYLPTADPPHKEERLASAAARFAMVELAVLHEESLYACEHELTPGRPSYTVETVEHFRSAQPGAELFVLLGADSLLALPGWRRWRDLLELATVVVLQRPGWDASPDAAGLAPEIAAAAARGEVQFLDNRRWQLSSTTLRERLARGEEPAPEAFPPLVLDYLRKYRPYDATAARSRA